MQSRGYWDFRMTHLALTEHLWGLLFATKNFQSASWFACLQPAHGPVLASLWSASLECVILVLAPELRVLHESAFHQFARPFHFVLLSLLSVGCTSLLSEPPLKTPPPKKVTASFFRLQSPRWNRSSSAQYSRVAIRPLWSAVILPFASGVLLAAQMTSAPRPLLAAPSTLAVGSLSVASPTPVPTSLLGSLVYAYSRFYAGCLVNPWSCCCAAAAFTSCATAPKVFVQPPACLPDQLGSIGASLRPSAWGSRLCATSNLPAFQLLSRLFLSFSSSSVFPVIYV